MNWGALKGKLCRVHFLGGTSVISGILIAADMNTIQLEKVEEDHMGDFGAEKIDGAVYVRIGSIAWIEVTE